MFEFKHLKTGGIESKFILLLTICILLVSAIFSGAGIYQGRSLESLSEKTKKQQIDAISKYSKGMVEEIVRKEMTRSVELEALVTDGSFEDLKARVTLLAGYAKTLLSDPDSLPQAEWTRPTQSMINQYNTIVMLPDDVDETDPTIAAHVGQLANLSDMMDSLCEATGAVNVYISTPEGIHLATSKNASSWIKEDGTLKSFDPRERYWYQEAVEAGELIFTDVGDDRETGQLCIVCAMPVYDDDGNLLAVAGSDFFLTKIQEAVESAGGDGEFHVITNQNGQVIFSPQKSGELKAPEKSVYGEDLTSENLETSDLRKSDNKELASFVTDLMEGKSGIRIITLSDGTYYIVGSTIPSLGWTEISVFSRDKVDETITRMTEKYTSIQDDAQHELLSKRVLISSVLAALLTAVVLLMLFEAKKQGQRIVKPLNLMTKRISEIKGEDNEFTMEDSYRTGDEIEILAESFAQLSHSSKDYIAQVKTATAERERISTELQMATQIQ
ncbi:MAG: methyl-accepting chemotaxis protein, partial [Desulfovibrionaceae bacterium]|nr:methyl-accepting chemotaxis protein [Desulfovibrionaceae bacterium]